MEKSNTGIKFWYELKDLLAGAAFPLMLMVVINSLFIGMAFSLIDDLALAIVMLVIGEGSMIAAYIVFGRYSGITSVRRLVQHAKKRKFGTTDKESLFGTGEYAAYKGFVIGFISCIPYMIIQLVQCFVENTFCSFMLEYIFGWAVLPFELAKLSPWFNFLAVIVPVAAHGVAYIIGANKEWDKQQRVGDVSEVVGGEGSR